MRVLVVEDEVRLAQAVQRGLEAEGFDVDITHNGTDGFVRAQAQKYDAIVLASPRLARENPEVIDALRALSGTIDARSMQRMNDAVDSIGKSPAAVAAEFLAAVHSP